jgi:hypothetical protein
MVCYQVTAQFVFHQHRPALLSTHVKKQKAKAFLVLSGLPFGHGLKYSRFFHTKKEAVQYVSYLHAVYKGRIIPNPAQSCARTGEGVGISMPHGVGLNKCRCMRINVSSPPLPGGQQYLFQEVSN